MEMLNCLRTQLLRAPSRNPLWTITHVQILTRQAQHTISPSSIRHLTRLAPRPRLRSQAFRNVRSKRYNSTNQSPSPNPTPHLGSPEPTSLSARLKKLSREYGWSALGVYLGLSALDFPFCFLAVRWLGTERIGYAEHVVVNGFWRCAEFVVPDARSRVAAMRAGDGVTASEKTKQEVETLEMSAAREGDGWGVEAAQVRNESDSASLWTQLALAYAIHKSFIFIRVPLTAAILPKVVKTLRGWGWKIGKRPPKITDSKV